LRLRNGYRRAAKQGSGHEECVTRSTIEVEPQGNLPGPEISLNADTENLQTGPSRDSAYPEQRGVHWMLNGARREQ
jgi:hypothetical protein